MVGRFKIVDFDGSCHAACRLSGLLCTLADTDASSVPPQVYAHASDNQVVNTTFPPVSPSKPSEAAPPVPHPQLSQSMAAPTALLSSNNPLPQRSSPQNGGGIAQPSQVPTHSQAPAVSQPLPSVQQPQSPESLEQDKSRVCVLLKINAYLLQEVVSLQGQGKAGGPPSSLPQQSPTQETGAASPASASDPSNPLNNSPIDPTRPPGSKPPSPEYIECMRRLQANLSYLAAIADAKKKAAGTVPVAPAIMTPPPHFAAVRELYTQLNALFQGAGQSLTNKALTVSASRSHNTG